MVGVLDIMMETFQNMTTVLLYAMVAASLIEIMMSLRSQSLTRNKITIKMIVRRSGRSYNQNQIRKFIIVRTTISCSGLKLTHTISLVV